MQCYKCPSDKAKAALEGTALALSEKMFETPIYSLFSETTGVASAACTALVLMINRAINKVVMPVSMKVQ